ncbi:MAG: NAD(P)-dependent oxidoreductase [Planctomycetia bacterium]
MSSEKSPIFFPVSADDVAGLQGIPEALVTTLAEKRILITGGTGFVGSWLLEALLHFNRTAALNLQLFVLTRDVQRWQQSRPHLASDPAISPIIGDILTPGEWESQLPSRFDLLIHGAFDSGQRPGTIPRLQVLEAILEGTRHVVSAAVVRSVQRVLFVSSGAVYGPLPPESDSFSEDSFSGPDPMAAHSAYAEGKRAAEAWGAAYCEQHKIDFVSGRLFAFAGPYLPINQHFAFGNFLRDALAKQTIQVSGSGQSVRSYLYGADLAAWLIRLLILGRDGRAYNVGSDVPVTILQLAHLVAKLAGRPGDVIVEAQGRTGHDSIYVPNVTRARLELGAEVLVSLEDSILRSLEYYRSPK